MIKKIFLKSGKERSLERFHPWVFSGAIQKKEEVVEGDLVHVFSHKNKFLGLGHYQDSSISVRVFSFEQVDINHEFWVTKLKKALNTRLKSNIITPETNMYRLVHGEGDHLSGLIVDVYGSVAVIQPHSYGMYLSGKQIANAIDEVFNFKLTEIILKHPSILKTDMEVEVLKGEKKSTYTAQEWSVKYNLDLIDGQKTGFFVDQRENRRILGELSKGKKVLNTFCYNGGFSLCALNSGAEKVVSVDVSKHAIEQTKNNLSLNNYSFEKHPCIAMDTFKFFESNNEDFDIIVLDPPAFAKHLSAKHNALKGYQRLNATALQHIKPGGILFTFSCSQVIDKELFYNAVVAASIQTGREIKVLQRLSQPSDHPVSIYHPEGEYLKGLILEVL